jgi:hypothetical protein
MRLSAIPTAYEESSILNAAKRKILALQVLRIKFTGFTSTNVPSIQRQKLLALQGNADLLQPFYSESSATTTVQNTDAGTGTKVQLLTQLLALQGNADLRQPFRYSHMGSLAYVGGDQAVADLSKSKVSTFDLFNVMTGKGAFLLWRSFYFSEQCRYCRTCALNCSMSCH